MSTPAGSLNPTFATVLRNSRLASVPRALTTGDGRRHPTHQVIQSPSHTAARGDFGLKSTLPLYTAYSRGGNSKQRGAWNLGKRGNKKRRDEYVTVGNLDTPEGFTDFYTAEHFRRTLAKVRELGTPATMLDATAVQTLGDRKLYQAKTKEMMAGDVAHNIFGAPKTKDEKIDTSATGSTSPLSFLGLPPRRNVLFRPPPEYVYKPTTSPIEQQSPFAPGYSLPPTMLARRLIRGSAGLTYSLMSRARQTPTGVVYTPTFPGRDLTVATGRPGASASGPSGVGVGVGNPTAGVIGRNQMRVGLAGIIAMRDNTPSAPPSFVASTSSRPSSVAAAAIASITPAPLAATPDRFDPASQASARFLPKQYEVSALSLRGSGEINLRVNLPSDPTAERRNNLAYTTALRRKRTAAAANLATAGGSAAAAAAAGSTAAAMDQFFGEQDEYGHIEDVAARAVADAGRPRSFDDIYSTLDKALKTEDEQ
ncbi:mitochondrial 37S ribosomal protein bS1m [Limtongia smithiae]|uniref:mitochondrial 37S ribosomal protein bS1m n=1 Tax=Limtongia smithiae TaxID=1125753 RepID=UPI0034CEB91E